jgi:sulfite exporter TauE/SafE
MAFVMGLTGSLHCAGMCGPIMLIMPFQTFAGVKRWLAIFIYHLSRISVYALFALLLHSFKSVFNPQWQQYISITIGGLLLLAGILSFIGSKKFNLQFPWTSFIRRKFAAFIANPGLSSMMFAGLLNGLLPCGMVYMALSATVMTSSAFESMTLMYAFGLGTIPMLISITVLKGRVFFLRTSSLKKMAPALLFLFGCLFVIRGMNLGIPYLSPKVAVEHEEATMTCCHKH